MFALLAAASVGSSVAAAASSAAASSTPKHLLADDEALLEAHIRRLIADMTNEEKARQLDMYSGRDLLTDGKPDETKTNRSLGGLGIGRIHDFYAQDPKLANEVQRLVVMNSRHGIPALVGEEGVHGYQGDGHTIFPSPISTAASFNASLAYEIGRVIGREARSTGTHEIWSPVCGLAREPRWGRTNEVREQGMCVLWCVVVCCDACDWCDWCDWESYSLLRVRPRCSMN